MLLFDGRLKGRSEGGRAITAGQEQAVTFADTEEPLQSLNKYLLGICSVVGTILGPEIQ